MSLDETEKSNDTLPVSERERILELTLREFSDELLTFAAPAGDKVKFGNIKLLRKPQVADLETGDKIHPKLYRWLWNECRLLGIERVGDLVRVMKAMPPHKGGRQEPWLWITGGYQSGETRAVLFAYELFKKKGLFLESR